MTMVEQAFELFSAQEPEGWRVELVEGEICVTSPNDGQHAEIVAELRDQATDPDRRLGCYTGIGLKVPGAMGRMGGTGGSDRTGTPDGPTGSRLLPDLTIAPKGSFRNQLVWQDPIPVLLVAEVTAAFTAHRDRVRKKRAYARAGIPLYLLIDREAGEAVVCAEPSGDGYDHRVIHKLGTQVPIPAPLGFTLDTSEF
ncbi:Uma2 family endonuclease [Streptomyces sp. NPDC051742]|uniref:Uma2 family endonuclease n=1 Tax=unclassified Streptomyces TaxID=2593676 RepID=UPI00342BC6CE